MAISCICSECHRRIRVSDELTGKRIRCPDCAAPVLVAPVKRSESPQLVREIKEQLPRSQNAVKPLKLESISASGGADGFRTLAIGVFVGLLIVCITGIIGVTTLYRDSDESHATALDKPERDVGSSSRADSGPDTREKKIPSSSSVSDAVEFFGEDISNTSDQETPPIVALSPVAETFQGESTPEVSADVLVDLTAETSTTEPFAAEQIPEADPIPEANAASEPRLFSEPSELVSDAIPEVAPSGIISAPDSIITSRQDDNKLTAGEPEAVEQLLKTACHRCHGESGSNEGGMNYVANLEKVRDSLVSPGDPDGSELIRRIASTNPETVMPPAGEAPTLSQENIETVRKWIQGGAHITPPEEKRMFISDDQILTAMHSDLQTIDKRSRRFIRYFSLIHLYNAGVSDDELETWRLAFGKMINSLSWAQQLIHPHKVNERGTILRVDIRELNWDNELWEEITEVNPYPFRFQSKLANQCSDETHTPQPCIRADWFVFKASRPPLYHQLLKIPESDGELEQMLHVDSTANIEQEKVIRAGFNRSGVSRNNRLIERHAIPYGAYWKSYDFAANTGRQNLFDFPGGPDGDECFEHDGGELIFTLPNGLQGYMLTDSNGGRLDSGPTSIVSDPGTDDRTVINGVSCFSCHFAGIVRKEDEIRPFLELNRKSYENTEYLLAIYPGQSSLDQYYKADGDSYVKTLASLGIANASRGGEPISGMSRQFQSELSGRMAAAEFGLSENDFYRRLEETPDLPRSLGALRIPGGTLKRDAFTELFGECQELLHVDSNTASREAESGLPRTIANSIQVQSSRVATLAVSPNGTRTVVCSLDHGLMLFDSESGKQLRSMSVDPELLVFPVLQYSPNGEYLLTAGISGKISVWEITAAGKMKIVSTYHGHSSGVVPDRVEQMMVSGDGKTVVSCSVGPQVHVWSLQDGKQIRSLAVPDQKRVAACWISSDAREIRLVHNNSLTTFLSYSERPPVSKPLSEGLSGQAAFSPDGKLLAVAKRDEVLLYNTATGVESARIIIQHLNPHGALFFADRGKCLLVRQLQKLSCWRISNQESITIPEIKLLEPGTTNVATSANSSICAWVEKDGLSVQIRQERISGRLLEGSADDRKPPSFRRTPRSRFKVGEKAELQYGSTWMPVTILKVLPDGLVRIHWEGWSDTWDEDIMSTRLRRLGENTAPPR